MTSSGNQTPDSHSIKSPEQTSDLIKWAVSLVLADGHFSLPQGLCVAMYGLTYSLYHNWGYSQRSREFSHLLFEMEVHEMGLPPSVITHQMLVNSTLNCNRWKRQNIIWFHTIVCCLAETSFHKSLDVWQLHKILATLKADMATLKSETTKLFMDNRECQKLTAQKILLIYLKG